MLRPTALAVKALPNYKLEIEFDDNTTKIFDMLPLLNFKCYENLKDENLFAQAIPNGISIEWPGGIDVCPDELYNNSKLDNIKEKK